MDLQIFNTYVGLLQKAHAKAELKDICLLWYTKILNPSMFFRNALFFGNILSP